MVKNSFFWAFSSLYLIFNYWLEGRLGFYRLFFLAALWFGLTWAEKKSWGPKIAWGFGALLIILLHLSFFNWPTISGPDAKGFWTLAHGNPSMELDLFRPKLYPWILKLFPNLETVGFFQLSLKLGMLVCLFFCGRLLQWKKMTLFFCLLVFSLNALWLREPFLLSDTTTYTFLILICLVCFIWHIKSYNIKSLLLFALFAGLASLTRQILDPALILSLIFLICYRFHPKKILSLGLFLSVVGLGPISNYAKYGIAKRSVALGVNIYTHSSFYALQIDPAKSQSFLKDCPAYPFQIPLYWNTHYKAYVNTQANALPHQYQLCLESKGMTRIESDAFLTREFFNWVKNNPGLYLYSVANELRRLLVSSSEYYPPRLFSDFKNSFPGSTELIRFERQISYLPIWWLLATLVTLLLTVKTVKSKWLAPSLLAISLGYFILISAIQIGFTRYSLPMLPLLLIAICHKLDDIATKKKGI